VLTGMTDTDFSYSLVASGAADALFVSALVDAAGQILGGNFPEGFAPDAMPATLDSLIRPYRGLDFAAWWQRARERAQRGEEFRGMALLYASEGEPQPITVVITGLPGREELLVSGYRAVHRHMALMTALQDIGLAVARLDPDRVLQTVREKVCALLPAEVFFVGLYDKEADQIRMRERMDRIQPLDPLKYAPMDGLLGWVVHNQQNLLIEDTERDVLPVTPRLIREGPMARSGLIVPLLAHNEVVGVLSIQSYTPNTYTEEDLWLLDAIAGQTGVAIWNAHLYEQTASRLATLAALQSTSLRFTAALERPRIAEVVGEAVMELLKPDEVRVYLRVEARGELKFMAGRSAAGETLSLVDPDEESLAVMVDQNGTPFILNQVNDHPGVKGDFSWPPASLAAYPIRRAGQRFGVMILLHRESHFYRQDERRTLSLMGHQVAIAVENTYYHDNLVSRLEEVSALYALAQQVTEKLDSEVILKLFVRTLRDIFRCRACVIALREPDSDTVVIRAAEGVKMQWREAVRFEIGEGSIAGQVVATGKSIYVPDVYESTDKPIFDPEVHSVIAVPIMFQGRVIGSLNLDSRQKDAFSPEHERILTIAAAQVAAALENARLYQMEAERAQKLEEANAELHNQERLREELIQNLSHELRTPLTYVKGYASLLRDGDMGDVDDTQKDALRIILEKADAIQRLIGDVVSLEQISAHTLDLEYIEVDKLVREAVASARMIQGADQLTLDLIAGDDLGWLHGDRSRINQAIDNLLGNAVKFTPEGGMVTLEAVVKSDGQAVQISIQDTGIGIAPEYLQRIFDRFYQIKDPARRGAGGSGIGLALVQRIAEAHGGQIAADSEYGKGSTFTLTLPRLENRPDGDHES
jgi:signal transduction histidine kinase